MQIKKIKRISVKELFGLKRTDDGAEHMRKLIADGHTKIFRIKGRMTGFASKQTQYGESFALLGDFLAQNLVTGELFTSGKAYLTKDFSETVVGRFKNRHEAESAVEFTAEVEVMKDSSVATGYSYSVDSIETEEKGAWINEAAKEFAALPAPKEVKKIANGKK